MSDLYLLQFACFLFMLFNALVLLITRIQVKWISPRYERSRRFVLAGIIGMAAHFFAQMCYGFRATNDAMGATINILIYTPCFSLIALGIYHIEATHMRRWRIYVVSSAIYVAIVTSFGIGYFQHDSLHIGNWLYRYQGDTFLIARRHLFGTKETPEHWKETPCFTSFFYFCTIKL